MKITTETYNRLPDKYKALFEQKKSDVVEQVFLEQGGERKSGSINDTGKGFGNSDIYNNGAKIRRIASASTGSASRFFNSLPITDMDAPFLYQAKASKAERNEGLDCSDLVWEKGVWEKQGLSLLTENINQLSMDISAEASMENKPWSTDLYGHSISEQYPAGMISTISTVIKLIIELKTLSVSPNLSTKGVILGAIKTIEASGLSLAKSAEHLSQSSLNTTSEKTESLLGVVNAVLPMLLKIRSCANSGNFHSTVKPIALMEWLVKLVTPPGGTCLDPFMGSGTTGIAAKRANLGFVGIEREKEYYDIACQRIRGDHEPNRRIQ